ncbi:uncharacterized protein LOC128472849 [Spea bombifrons]|uniref:uncharacterized protein LOC128472849 n=1 Tax=Spea bombifrons TaxID=233779 RepID=UPI00234A9144|nr:uncharacterized protein LOC128472849 [Spea bombifrons]
MCLPLGLLLVTLTLSGSEASDPAQCRKPAGGGINIINQVINGKYRPSGSQEYYNPGDVIAVWCQTGYYPPHGTYTCQSNGTGSDWDKPVSCTAQCMKPAGGGIYIIYQVINGEYIPSDSQEYYYPRDVIAVRCQAGYYPPQGTYTCQSNSTDSDWDKPVSCTAQCKKPAGGGIYIIYQVINGEYMPSDSQEYYYPGDVIAVWCQTGYYPPYWTYTCQSSGTGSDWDKPVSCTAQCKKPAGGGISTINQVINGGYKRSDPQEYYNPGDVIDVRCQTRYYPPLSTYTCQSSGTGSDWDKPVSCTAQCKKPAGGGISTINGVINRGNRPSGSQEYYNPGDVIAVGCQTGYYPPHRRYTCQSSGTGSDWNKPVSCTAQCKKPAGGGIYIIYQVINGEFIPSDSQEYYNPGDVIAVGCQTGYYPPHGRYTCQSSGTGSNWDKPASCTAQCKKPAGGGISTINQVINGGNRPSGSQEYYNPGDVIAVRCQTGYYPPHRRYTCQSSGTGSDWDKPVSCTEKCKIPGSLKQNVIINTNQKYFDPNTKVTVGCSPGFNSTVNTITCTTSRGRNDWDVDVRSIKCIPQCVKPSGEGLLSLSRYKRYYDHGDSVTVTCADGFQPSSIKLQCMSLGASSQWDVPVPCVRILVTPPISTSTSVSVQWACEPDPCLRVWEFTMSCCPVRMGKRECQTKVTKENTTFSNLSPFTEYEVALRGKVPGKATSPFWETRIKTKEATPDKPEIVKYPNIEENIIKWSLNSNRGLITGYQMNISARRDYNNSFAENESLRFPPNVTEFKIPFKYGTNYTINLRGLTSAGAGGDTQWSLETPIKEPPVPLQKAVSVRSKMADLLLHPVPDLNGPISYYEVILSSGQTFNLSQTCAGYKSTHYNSSINPVLYTAALLPAQNLSRPMTLTLGDGVHYSGFFNAPLISDQNYTVYVRVSSTWREVGDTPNGQPRGKLATSILQGDGAGPSLLSVDRINGSPCHFVSLQAEKSSCAFIGSFQVAGHSSVPLVVGLCSAAAVFLIGLAVFWKLGLYRSLRTKSFKSAGIPLKNKEPPGRKEDIPVGGLLEAVKRFRASELNAAEGTDMEENLNLLSFGRFKEYKELPSGLLSPCDVAKMERNLGKNRFKNIIPYDGSRVVLRSSPGGSDYINASYVDGYKSPKFFIATQGPLPDTLADFWRMVWQENSSVIVMLTDLKENNKVKSECYWPENTETYGDITVSLERVEQTGATTARRFTLKKTQSGVRKTVDHFHYLAWPDHGVPIKPSGLSQLLEQVNTSQGAGSGPVIVHCSAGIGRTGTFIALDISLKMAKEAKKVNVFNCVRRLRRQRVNMVQNKEQYAFLYEILLETLLCGVTCVAVPDLQKQIQAASKRDPATKTNRLAEEFQALEPLNGFYGLSCVTQGKKPENAVKNRDPHILPGDHCRPILMSTANTQNPSGYINAVFVSSNCGEDVFVVTQLPMKHTVCDFWSLVWDYRCGSVVLMHGPQELTEICKPFWPNQGEARYGAFCVKRISKSSANGYKETTFSVQQQNESLEVRFWQVTCWPKDQPVPQDPEAFIHLIGEVEKRQQRMENSHIIVTCRDGASRSGLFCAGSVVCDQIRSDGLLDVSQAVRGLRKRRVQLVPNADQYGFCYTLAQSYVQSFDTYGNFK